MRYKHKWILKQKKKATYLWECENCKIQCITGCNDVLQSYNIHKYVIPSVYPKSIKNEIKEEVEKNGKPKCFCLDCRMIKNILE